MSSEWKLALTSLARSQHGRAAGDVLLENYRLCSCVATGSTMEFWLAADLSRGGLATVELIRRPREAGEPLAIGEAERARFVTGNQVTARLSHAAVPEVIDSGFGSDGDALIITRALVGQTLRREIERQGRLLAIVAVRLLLPVVDAVRQAHAIGVLHEWINSESIFLSLDGDGRVRPKLLGFGVSSLPWLSDAAGLDPDACEYVAPERLSFEDPADPRDDVWSLGVVLYQMIAGATPWRVITGPLPRTSFIRPRIVPLDERYGVDAPLWSILDAALRPRALRLDSAAELGTRLASWLLSKGVEDDLEGTALRARWLSKSPRPELRSPARAEPSRPRSVRPVVPPSASAPSQTIAPVETKTDGSSGTEQSGWTDAGLLWLFVLLLIALAALLPSLGARIYLNLTAHPDPRGAALQFNG